jgi:hypothetical protein
VLGLSAGLLVCSSALGAPAASLSAALVPEHLGRPASIVLGVKVRASAGRLPAPLTSLSIRYPAGLGIALSGLGIETCTAAVLESEGPAGCPRDSVMGYGSALGGIPFGPELIEEGAAVSIFRAPDSDGRLALLFDAQGISPVKANIVLSALLLPARAPFGGSIGVTLPLIASLPEGPDVAVLELRATIGPAAGMTYTETIHEQQTTYRPKGILLPARCPRGGFPFAAALSFEDGSRATATATARCPSRRHRRHGRQPRKR